MHTISIGVSDKNDLQLLKLLVKRLGLKIVEKPAKPVEEKKDLAYHRKVIETGGVMTEERMEEMLKWLEEDRSDDGRSERPSLKLLTPTS